MSFLLALGGAARYEFWMQLRRRSVWVVIILLELLIFSLWLAIANRYMVGTYADDTRKVWLPPNADGAVLMWAQIMAMFLPVGVGLLLADRMARDGQTHVDELFETLPGSLGARMLGKYLGCTLATLVPVLLCYTVGVVYIMLKIPNLHSILIAVEAFAAMLLPGILFVAGFSIAFPIVLKVPIYQFLFVGYWFWANLMSPKIGLPSPVGTIINAAGPYASEGLFNFQWTFLILHTNPLQASASIALLIGLGLIGLAAGWGYLRFQQASR